MWRINPKDKPCNQPYYRQCGPYTICKYGQDYCLTSRKGDEIVIHGWFPDFKSATDEHEKICKLD